MIGKKERKNLQVVTISPTHNYLVSDLPFHQITSSLNLAITDRTPSNPNPTLQWMQYVKKKAGQKAQGNIDCRCVEMYFCDETNLKHFLRSSESALSLNRSSSTPSLMTTGLRKEASVFNQYSFLVVARQEPGTNNRTLSIFLLE